MDVALILGLIAGAFTTFANVPQLVKSWKSKSTHDLSMWWLAILAIGVILWIGYGYYINEFPIVLANIITLAIVGALIFLKLKYG